MPSYLGTCAAALLLGLPGAASAATTFFVADGAWPTDTAVFGAERAAWASSLGGTVSTEGFNALTGRRHAPPLVMDDFTLTRDQTESFLVRSVVVPMQDGGNEVIITDSDVIYFDFLQPINAFAIDWANFDKTSTSVDYADDAGNTLNDIFLPVPAGGGGLTAGGFFGIFSDTSFTSLQFTLTSTEQLNFDNVQYGALIGDVPAPPAAMLLLGGFGAFAFLRRRRRDA
jgi:MYXO-CTERM domain-containing protein